MNGIHESIAASSSHKKVLMFDEGMLLDFGGRSERIQTL